MRPSGARVWLLWALAAASCTDTGQNRVAIPLRLAGSELAAPALAHGAIAVQLERADLAFGPLYLCAGEQAGDTCETARAEWLSSAIVNLLDPEPSAAGVIEAVTGSVHSYMYDLGLTSILTREEPLTLAAAEALGGFSLVLEGRARLASGPAHFTAHVALAQSPQTELGVPVVRSSAVDRFEHEIVPGEPGLDLRFDVRQLIAAIDFEQACAGQSDCGELDPNGQGIRAIRQALSAGARPEFRWAETDD